MDRTEEALMSTATLIGLLVGTVIPGLTAMVTKDQASAKVKAVVTAGLAAVSGGLTAYLTSPPHGTAGWEQFIGTILVTWIASSAAYFFGWKPTGAAHVLAEHTASFGIGKAPPA